MELKWRGSAVLGSSGLHLTNDFTWSLHTSKVVRSACQRLFFLRRLRKFGLPPDILTNFYRCTIENILTACITVWYGSCAAYDRKAPEKEWLLESSNPVTCPVDPIPSTLLQSISLDLLPFISSLMNCSLSSGHVTQAFKTARVVPILKKPSLDSSDVSSYRPNQLQDINQSGFKPAHSTETALIAEVICCRDIGLLAVSLRPYYMLRELSHANVDIALRADVQVACDIIHSIAALQTKHPDAFYVISGDFNHATLDSTLSAFFQFVDCPTRKNRTTDLLYAKVRDAYRATPLPPLGKSDHNLVLLQPQYKPLVLRQPTTTHTLSVWSPEAEEALKDCYDTTDWSLLLHPHGEDIEEVTHCVMDYLNFCIDVAVPTKTVRCFPNNKPWITSDVKDILNQQERAFRDGNWTELKRVQGELKVQLGGQGVLQEKGGKEAARQQHEGGLGSNENITGCKNNSGSSVGGGVDGANQFNTFYNRFDCPAAPSYPPAAFTTITLTSTIPVIITIISRRTEQHPRFPLSPSLHGRPSQETAEETTPQEGGRPGQSVPQNA
ncbi:hypothetical protein NFI96_002878 [Prochilodus magdalenae]|nr:hypothetical protein NFI96_002878 [Prochilodus magdalenae]